MYSAFYNRKWFRQVCLFLFSLFIWFLMGCETKQTITQQQLNETNPIQPDTIIGSKSISNELAGSAYRKRATTYFLIIHKDTSLFNPVFTEAIEGEAIGLELRLPDRSKAITYRQMLGELQFILPEAAKEYDINQLRSMNLGRLVRTGDLAVEISRQYTQKFGEKTTIRTSDYGKVSQFLLQTPLATDLNQLFKPYGLSVSQISVEKVFFTTKQELLYGLTLETDTSQLPDGILDCQTWIRFKPD